MHELFIEIHSPGTRFSVAYADLASHCSIHMLDFFPFGFFFFFKRGLVSDIIANDSPVIALPHLFSLPLFLALYFLENISLCQDQSTSKQFWTINLVHISHMRSWQICELTDREPFGGDVFCQQTFPPEQQAAHRRRAPARQSQPALLLCCCRRRAVNVTLSRNTSIPKNQATIF